MKPLKSPRVIPTSSRQYWSVDLSGKGIHHFKHPYYGIGSSVSLLSGKYRTDPESTTVTAQEQSVNMLPFIGAMLGVSWCHRALELETPYPLKNVSIEALEEYGTDVIQELQDADYNLLEILDMFGMVAPEFIKRQSLVELAMARVAFTEPLKVDSISN